jgi:hypothetical protein
MKGCVFVKISLPTREGMLPVKSKGYISSLEQL